MEGISPAFMAEHPGTPGDKALPGKSGSSEKAENIPDSQVFINTTGISKIAITAGLLPWHSFLRQ